jgi:hypothetical protein
MIEAVRHDAKPQVGRWPSRAVIILMVAAAGGVAGVAWSQRDLLAGAEVGVLADEVIGLDGRPSPSAQGAVVRWSLDAGGALGPRIVADVAIPERRMNIRFAIWKNSDEQLPASHIVEIVTEPAKFPGKSIAVVPLVYVKEAPDSRGRQLIGAAATVAENRFWIALSSDPFDVRANLELLRSGEVFELSMAYDTGRPAALLFEKGTTGKRAFEEASAMWAQ